MIEDKKVMVIVGFDFLSPEHQIKDLIVVDEKPFDKTRQAHSLPEGEYRLYWDRDLIDWVVEEK